MDRQILNSTFAEDFSSKQKLWAFSCGSSSMSSIEKVFDPMEIKKIVDDLVMTKFGFKTCEMTGSRCSISTQSDFSVDTSHLSELISLNSRSHVPAPEEVADISETLESPSAEYYVEHSSIRSMNEKLMMLNHTKEQILKAIHYDDTFNQGAFSRERLEAEKLLLVTDTEIDSIFSELGNASYEEETMFHGSGNLKLARIHLWPKEMDGFDHHFVCLLVYGTKIYSTKISKMKSNGVIYFNDEMALSSLPPDFEIVLKIYSIPVKIIKKRSKSFACRHHRRGFDMDVPLRQSQFSLWGETTIRLCDITKSGMLQVKLNSGLLTAAVTTSANLHMNLSGFLNVSRNCGQHPLWNRQWTCLQGKVVKCFNYPPSGGVLEDSADCIDLSSCKELRIASREECPRSQTLVMETKSGQRVFISCDSRYEFDFWQEYLSRAVFHLRLWERC